MRIVTGGLGSDTHLAHFPGDLDTFLHWLLTALLARHLDTGLLGDLGANVSGHGSADLAGNLLALLRLDLSGHLGALLPGDVLAVLLLNLETKHSLTLYIVCSL